MELIAAVEKLHSVDLMPYMIEDFVIYCNVFVLWYTLTKMPYFSRVSNC